MYCVLQLVWLLVFREANGKTEIINIILDSIVDLENRA